MRGHKVIWDGLAVCLLAVGLSVAGWAFTHRSSDASSCQDFSQPADGGHTRAGHTRGDMSSLARAQSVTLSKAPRGGLHVLWQFNQAYPNLGQETVGELQVDIRQESHTLILVIPTRGSIGWTEMGQSVKFARTQQRPAEVMATYSRSQIFGLTGSFVWNAQVDYGFIHEVTSSCPRQGSPRVTAG